MRPHAHLVDDRPRGGAPRAGTQPRPELDPPLPGSGAVRARAAGENFPVALRLLRAPVRADLLAIYDFARLTDELGDQYPGDRLAALDWLERDLDALAPGGQAGHPVVAALAGPIARHPIDVGWFRDLIEANRRDQRKHRYATFDELLDYCRYSADPVGRLVLAVFDVDDPALTRLSDDVCSGLQVVEHLQDVGEDLAAGRVYLPQDDLARFGCTDDDLRRPAAGEPLRSLIEFEAGRATTLLGSGARLVAGLPMPARLAVAGFVAGGLAALDAIAAAGYDVLAQQCRPSRRRLAWHAVRLLARRGAR
jgi:squalene synthase HpnC